MNYFLLLVGAYMAIGNLRQNGVQHNITEWKNYVTLNNKTFDTPQIESMRRAIFTDNKHQIDQFNLEKAANNKSTFELGLNHLADLAQIEIKARNGFKMTNQPQRNTPEAEQYLESILSRNTEVPDSFDWREHAGRVSQVKDQGECGSCWAFSAVGALEGQEYKARPVPSTNSTEDEVVELSEQNLVDCAKMDEGCNGGIMQDAFDQVKIEGGIDSEASYPYEGRNGRCRFNKTNSVISDKGFVLLPEGDEEKLKETVAKFGPVSVAIDASDFRFTFYKRGVYYNKHCKTQELDHGVLVVGYGTDKVGGDYWIVKNSWSPRYGENGYVRMARNRSNHCGIATNAVIPIVA